MIYFYDMTVEELSSLSLEVLTLAELEMLLIYLRRLCALSPESTELEQLEINCSNALLDSAFEIYHSSGGSDQVLCSMPNSRRKQKTYRMNHD